ncbi:hypothetical protein ACQW02_15785 [Humitalea sp. 24SJ18S-53]|uniref:hypothetical protein n=1 Tax=Humitalea sp. 24SJ18S-53 TaxID=3422307 RepID=UPI003D675876
MLRRLALACGLSLALAAPLGAQTTPAPPVPATPAPAPQVQAPPGTGDPSFNLVNRSRNVINEVYASLSTEDAWGPDRLGASTVPAGGTFPIRLPQGACEYDLRVVYQGRPAEERRRVNLCTVSEVVFTGQAPTATPAPGGKGAQAAGPTGNPSFNVINRTGQIIRELYVSASSRTDWGPDILGTEVLQVGAHFEVRLPEGECLYDVRIVFQNGANTERRSVNTCDIANMMFP